MSATAAGRYAEALLDSVWNEEAAARQATSEELARLARASREIFDLRNALENPSYSSEERLRVLDAVAEELSLSKRLKVFTRLVVERGRAVEISEISETFDRLLAARGGRVTAFVTSAAPLDEAEKSEIQRALERVTGQSVDLELTVDSTLIGGVRAEVGSTVYDGSIRAELGRLRELLAED